MRTSTEFGTKNVIEVGSNDTPPLVFRIVSCFYSKK